MRRGAAPRGAAIPVAEREAPPRLGSPGVGRSRPRAGPPRVPPAAPGLPLLGDGGRRRAGARVEGAAASAPPARGVGPHLARPRAPPRPRARPRPRAPLAARAGVCFPGRPGFSAAGAQGRLLRVHGDAPDALSNAL